MSNTYYVWSRKNLERRENRGLPEERRWPAFLRLPLPAELDHQVVARAAFPHPKQ